MELEAVMSLSLTIDVDNTMEYSSSEEEEEIKKEIDTVDKECEFPRKASRRRSTGVDLDAGSRICC